MARETLENDQERRWFVQCRRYQRGSQRTLCQAVDDAIAKTDSVPDVLLVVLGCDVRKNAQDGLIDTPEGKGLPSRSSGLLLFLKRNCTLNVATFSSPTSESRWLLSHVPASRLFGETSN